MFMTGPRAILVNSILVSLREVLVDPDVRINTQYQTGRQGAAIRHMHSRKTVAPYLIISPLVDWDFVIITPNIYARALSCVWTKVIITSTIPGTKSGVISIAPALTMTDTCIRWTRSLLRIWITVIITNRKTGIVAAMFWMVLCKCQMWCRD